MSDPADRRTGPRPPSLDTDPALRHGFRTVVRFDDPAGEELRGLVLGLWPVDDGAVDALVVDLADGRRWALRRVDGRDWTAPDGARPDAGETEVPVECWTADVEPGVVAAPEAARSGRFRAAG